MHTAITCVFLQRVLDLIHQFEVAGRLGRLCWKSSCTHVSFFSACQLTAMGLQKAAPAVM